MTERTDSNCRGPSTLSFVMAMPSARETKTDPLAQGRFQLCRGNGRLKSDRCLVYLARVTALADEGWGGSKPSHFPTGRGR